MRQSPERELKGGELGERRSERFERKDNRIVERRRGRPEARNERGYQNTQSVRRSRERSLGRPMRDFINTISGGFSGKESSSARKKILENCQNSQSCFEKKNFATNAFYI